jgi:hypothetical protein
MNRIVEVRAGFMAGWRESRRLHWVAPLGVVLGGALALYLLVRSGGG